MSEFERVAVLGAGSWGTALAVHFANVGHEVTLWARRPEAALELSQERVNSAYLPGVSLPQALRVTASLEDLSDVGFVVVVVPSHGFREILAEFLFRTSRSRSRELTVISATKGIETDTLARMSEVTAQVSSTIERRTRFAVLSGPTFAAELAAGIPSAAVVAAEEETLASRLSAIFSNATLRLYSSTDVAGVELGGASKNVIAVASGLVSGLGLGHNTVAALITRGLHEITRLGLACGGDPRTFSGLAGLGDLVLTCTGGLSRNRQTGMELAAGRTLADIQSGTTMVAEGVKNSLSVSRLAGEVGVEMPIVEQMMQVIYEAKAPARALEELMTRQLKAETEL